jgi:hypothetical protein
VLFNCTARIHFVVNAIGRACREFRVLSIENSIVSLPGNLSAKDTEKFLEVSPEKKVKEGEKGVEKGKAEPTVDEACWIYEQLRSVSCILRFWNYG